MKLRTTFLTLLTILALAIGSVAQAQDDGFGLCFGLDGDDCEAINAASANGIGDAESFTLDFSIDFAADGLGSIAALAAQFGDPSMAEDPITDVTFTFDASMDFAMNEDSMTGLYMNGTMGFSFSQNGGEVEEMSADVMLVDDTLYIHTGEGWSSIDILALLEDEALGGQIDGLLGDATADGGADAMEDLGVDPMALGALAGILDLPGFLNYERSGDDFVFTVDFGALQGLLDEENEDLLNGIIETASEIDPSMALFVPLIPTLISDGNIVITQTIDSDNDLLTDLVVESELELALGMLAGTADVTTTDLTVEISLDNLDGVSMEDAPDDAIDITDIVLNLVSSTLGQ